MIANEDRQRPGRDDQVLLYSLAANCRLYEEDQQPPRLNVGSDAEPRLVPPSEAWRDFYARNLVEHYRASTTRLDAARTWATDARQTAAPSEPGSNRFGQAEWDIAIELCDRGLAIVRGAGAEHDPFARRRLLAALAHTLHADTFGSIPGVIRRSAQDLLDELERIDLDERGEQAADSHAIA